MDKLIIFQLLFTFTLSQICPSSQFSYYDVCVPAICQTYIWRIENRRPDQSGPIYFQGAIQNSDGSVTLTLEFKDVEHDGRFNRDNINSCISSELIRYNQAYIPQGYNETAITSTFNAAAGYRNWSFTITSSQFSQLTYAQVNDQGGITNYTGYFAYRFNVSIITQYIYYFTFTFGVNTQPRKTNATAQLIPSMTYKGLSCLTIDNCVTAINTAIEFSTTPACNNVTQTISPVLNNNIFVCVSIITPGFQSYKLTSPKIIFTGLGLNFPAIITGSLVSGIYTSYTITMPFVYSNIAITVSAVAKPNTGKFDYTRQLEGEIPAGGSSEQLGCIKVSSTAKKCPTSAELAANPPCLATQCSKIAHILTIVSIIVFLLI